MVLALAVGMLALPAAQEPAEAHVVNGKTTVKKPEKLSGSVYRGEARVRIAKTNGNEFDAQHIQRRRLVSWIEVRNSRTSPIRIDSRTVVQEMWNKRYSSTQRPNARCKKGWQVRTVARHTVQAPDVWKVGAFYYHGAVKETNTTRRSRWVTCK
jgi:hypothetical protein